MWQIATSSAAGALITLIGVFAGAVLTGRNQQRQWVRDKQIQACSDIIVHYSLVLICTSTGWALGGVISASPAGRRFA